MGEFKHEVWPPRVICSFVPFLVTTRNDRKFDQSMIYTNTLSLYKTQNKVWSSNVHERFLQELLQDHFHET